MEKIAKFWGIEFKGGLNKGDIADLSEKMKNKERIRKVIDKLTSREKQILGIFAIKNGVIECNDLYDFGIYEEELGNLPAYHWQTPKGLAGNALIFRTKKYVTHGPTVFVVPRELRDGIIYAFSESSEEMEFEGEVKNDRKEKNILDDIFSYIHFLYKESPTLTKSLQHVPKRYLDKLGIDDERLTFIQELCNDLGLVKKEYDSIEDAYLLKTTKKTEEFISKETEDKTKDIFEFILKKYNANGIIVVNGLKRLEVDVWYDFALFYKNLKSDLFLERRFEVWRRFNKSKVKHFLGQLALIGVINIGHGVGEKTVISLTPIGAHALGIKELDIEKMGKKFIIQPNFEITVFSETTQKTLFYLSKFTEIKSSDRVGIHLLTKNSVLNALDHGMDIDDIIDFLSANSQNEIPQNILYTLKDWGGKYGGVKIRRGTFFEADEELTYEIKRRIGPQVIKEVTPSTIIIEKEDDVRDLMKMHDEVFLEIDDPIHAKEVERRIEPYILDQPSPNVIVIKRECLRSVIQSLKRSEIYPKNLIK